MTTQSQQEATVTISHGGVTTTVPLTQYQATLDELVAAHGPWVPGVSNCAVTPAPAEAPAAPKANSDFGGALVHDEAAKVRIEGQHEALRAGGITVNTAEQFYATGTRMADVGYATQKQRRAEHLALRPLAEAADELRETIVAEKRENVVLKAGEIAKQLSINGKLKLDGYELREQALRGLLGRLESPAGSYIFGVRDRLAEEADPSLREQDKAIILDTLIRECRRNPEAECNLRLRHGLGDVFAVVSPSYGEADAPTVLPSVIEALSGYGDTLRAGFSYDPATTTWELRVQAHTPTPDDEQAVGEAFQGYLSVKSRDNGTGRLLGGGGILLIRCLNASVYTADGVSTSRVHRSGIVADLGKLIATAAGNIHVLCQAWGVARQDVLPVAIPAQEPGKLIPIEEVIQGYYRFALTERRGELVGVLPGRTAKHAEALALHFETQRRDKVNVTRADLAQGLTAYIQSQPLPVQQAAEGAVASWLVKRPAVEYLAA